MIYNSEGTRIALGTRSVPSTRPYHRLFKREGNVLRFVGRASSPAHAERWVEGVSEIWEAE